MVKRNIRYVDRIITIISGNKLLTIKWFNNTQLSINKDYVTFNNLIQYAKKFKKKSNF